MLISVLPFHARLTNAPIFLYLAATNLRYPHCFTISPRVILHTYRVLFPSFNNIFNKVLHWGKSDLSN